MTRCGHPSIHRVVWSSRYNRRIVGPRLEAAGKRPPLSPDENLQRRSLGQHWHRRRGRSREQLGSGSMLSSL